MKNKPEEEHKEIFLQKNEKNTEKKESINSEEKINGLEPEIMEKIKQNPSVMKEVFMGIMKGPMFPPFLEKIEKEHITQALNSMDKELDYEYKDSQSSKKYSAFYVLFGVFAFIYLAHLFINTDNVELLREIVKIGGAVIIGGIGGYGICEAKRKKNN